MLSFSKIHLPQEKNKRYATIALIVIVIGLLVPVWFFLLGGWLIYYLNKKINKPKLKYAVIGITLVLTLFFGTAWTMAFFSPNKPNQNSTPQVDKAGQNSTQTKKSGTKQNSTEQIKKDQSQSKQSTGQVNIVTPQSSNTQYYATFPSQSKTSNCHTNNGLPDPGCTPGAVDTNVTQSNIHQTICVSGYTSTVRPSTSYTNNLKTQQIKAYGYSDTSLSDYEEDHFIPLEIGGSPTSPANLWPESYNITWGSKQKDKVENYLHTQICNGSISLPEAQKAMAANWETIYIAHYGQPTTNTGIVSSTSKNTSSSSNTAPAPTSSSTSTPAPSSTNTGQYPAGTTGICTDGTYTQATHHQGACSHHGGVSQWIISPES